MSIIKNIIELSAVDDRRCLRNRKNITNSSSKYCEIDNFYDQKYKISVIKKYAISQLNLFKLVKDF